MRVLLDACVWSGALAALRESGHDALWAGEWPQDPGDDEILAEAHRERRILVTLDKDFGELAVVQRRPHSGIIRLVGSAARSQGAVCVEVLDRFGSELEAGAIVTADPSKVRVRPADDA